MTDIERAVSDITVTTEHLWLAGAWVAATIASYEAVRISGTALIPRALWTVLLSAALGLIYYYGLWTPTLVAPPAISENATSSLSFPISIGDFRLKPLVVGEPIQASYATTVLQPFVRVSVFAEIMILGIISSADVHNEPGKQALVLKYRKGTADEWQTEAEKAWVKRTNSLSEHDWQTTATLHTGHATLPLSGMVMQKAILDEINQSHMAVLLMGKVKWGESATDMWEFCVMWFGDPGNYNQVTKHNGPVALQ